ncbi:hypothetical protein GW17_00010191 [Ensete ventricosum]|nr:hypothetical protein GW17_00010191 [Ensete ventricosum]
METKLLKLTRAMDALWVDLPKQAIEDYKKLSGFEMGLVQMVRVSLEYGYQLALAQLWARASYALVGPIDFTHTWKKLELN